MAAKGTAVVAAHGAKLDTLKDCLQFLAWLNDKNQEVARTRLAGRLYRLLHKKYKSVDREKIEHALSAFLGYVSTFHKKLCNEARHTTYKPQTTKPALNALLECIPKVLAVMYYLRYQVDKNFNKVGGGEWAEKDVGMVASYAELRLPPSKYMKFVSKIDEYFIAKDNTKYGIIPGGFEPGELKISYNSFKGQAYHKGSDMKDDLLKILQKELKKQNYFLDVFSTTVLPTSGTQISNVANALRLVRDFCWIFENVEEHDFKSHLYTREKCINYQQLKYHCTQLRKPLDEIFTKNRFSFTAYGRDLNDLEKHNIAKAMASWFKKNLEELKQKLAEIPLFISKYGKQNIKRGRVPPTYYADLRTHLTKHIFPYGFTFDGNKFEAGIAPYEELNTHWDSAIADLRDKHTGLEELVNILIGTGCKLEQEDEGDDEEPEPPDEELLDDGTIGRVVTRTEAAKSVITKDDTTLSPANKVDAISNQGKKSEGAQNQGKKAEGAQNQGKKAEGRQNQSGSQSDGNGSSAGSEPPGAHASSSGRGLDGQAVSPGDRPKNGQDTSQSSTSATTTTSTGSSAGAGDGGGIAAKGDIGVKLPFDEEAAKKTLQQQYERRQKHAQTYLDTLRKREEEREKQQKKHDAEVKKYNQQWEQLQQHTLSVEGSPIATPKTNVRMAINAVSGQIAPNDSENSLQKQKGANAKWKSEQKSRFLKGIQDDMLKQLKSPKNDTAFMFGSPIKITKLAPVEGRVLYKSADANGEWKPRSESLLQASQRFLLLKDVQSGNLIGNDIQHRERKLFVQRKPFSSHGEAIKNTARNNPYYNRMISNGRDELNRRFKDAKKKQDSREATVRAISQKTLYKDLFRGGDVHITHQLKPAYTDTVDTLDIYVPPHSRTILERPDPNIVQHSLNRTTPQMAIEIPDRMSSNWDDPSNSGFQPTHLAFDFQRDDPLLSRRLDPIVPGVLIEKAHRDTPSKHDDPNYLDLQIQVPDRTLQDSSYDVDIYEPSPLPELQPLDPIDPVTTAISVNLPPIDPPDSLPNRYVTSFKHDAQAVGMCIAPWMNRAKTGDSTDIPETELFPAEAPRTVRDMLMWLAGLKNEKHHDTLEKCINKAFGGLNDDPSQLALSINGSQIRPKAVIDIIQLTAMFACSVLNSIAPNWKANASSRIANPMSNQSKEPDCCVLLCQLRDYAYACCHQLEFLKSQCGRDKSLGGWKSHEYGSDLKTSSPLHAFLTDSWDSTFETHPFDPCNLCHKSRVRMGFNRRDLPKTSQQGTVISTILSPSCGGEGHDALLDTKW